MLTPVHSSGSATMADFLMHFVQVQWICLRASLGTHRLIHIEAEFHPRTCTPLARSGFFCICNMGFFCISNMFFIFVVHLCIFGFVRCMFGFVIALDVSIKVFLQNHETNENQHQPRL